MPTVATRAWRGVIEEYRDRMPVTANTPIVTLLEGGTPLVPAPVISEMTGCDVRLKVEGANPTGSFKDRGMTMAISRAAEEGAKAVICASTGQHQRQRRRVRGARRHGLRGARPAGQDRAGQDEPGTRARLADPAGRRQLRRLPRVGPRAVRVIPRRPGQLGEPVPHRGPEERRVRDRRRARRRPATCTACRSATPATSPPTGRATGSTSTTACAPTCRGCSASRPPARHRSSTAPR